MADNLDDLKKRIEDLKKQLESLTRKKVNVIDPNSINTLDQANEAINLLNNSITETLRKQNDLEEGFGGIYDELTSIVGEMSRMNSATNITNKNFKGIQSIAQQLKYDQQDLSKLDEDQLKSLQKKLKTKQEEVISQSSLIKQQYNSLTLNARGEEVSEDTLKKRLKAARISKQEFAAMKAINAAAEDNFSVFDRINDQLEKRIKFEKESNDLLGTSYGLTKGIEGALGTLGFGNLASKLGFSEANDAMKEMADKIAKANENLAKQKDIQSQINALNSKGLSDDQIRAGFGGKALKDLMASKDAVGSTADAASGLGSTMKILGQGAKVFGQNLKAALGPAQLIVMAIEQLVEALKITDAGAGDMAKKMNMTYSEALNTRRELGNMAALSGDAAVTTKGLQETYMAIGQSLGSNAKLNEKDLITATKLREQAGYTNDQLAELNKLSSINGKSIEDNTKEILGGAKAYASRKGLVINEKQVLDDVVKASASLKLSLGGSADALAESAVKARAVGLNLEQAAAMADSLLNFESSIENELSAELLTGKDLNLEKARTLALNGDIAGAAEEIANQVGSSADFTEMNVIQQEALAKAAGLTKDQLAQSLMDREALAKLSEVEGKDAKEKFDNLVKQVGMEEAKRRLGNDQLANQYEQQNVQERFNQSVEKLKELFVQVAEPVLAIVSPLMDLVSAVLPAINFLLQPLIIGFQTIAGWVTSLIDGLKKGAPLAVALASAIGLIALPAITSAIGAIFSTFAQIPFGIGIPLAIASVVGLMSMLSQGQSKAKKGNDVMSPGTGTSGYGSRTLFGPEGAIALNNKDTVIAGTNLFDQKPEKANDMISGPKGAITVANSTAPKKETPVNPNSETNMLLSQLIKGQKEVNTIPTLRIQ